MTPKERSLIIYDNEYEAVIHPVAATFKLSQAPVSTRPSTGLSAVDLTPKRAIERANH
jgi:hypothetical protein